MGGPRPIGAPWPPRQPDPRARLGDPGSPGDIAGELFGRRAQHRLDVAATSRFVCSSRAYELSGGQGDDREDDSLRAITCLRAVSSRYSQSVTVDPSPSSLPRASSARSRSSATNLTVEEPDRLSASFGPAHRGPGSRRAWAAPWQVCRQLPQITGATILTGSPGASVDVTSISVILRGDVLVQPEPR